MQTLNVCVGVLNHSVSVLSPFLVSWSGSPECSFLISCLTGKSLAKRVSLRRKKAGSLAKPTACI